MYRPTLRLRLTLTYAALFVLAGAFLLALMYVLLDQALAPPDPPYGESWGPYGAYSGRDGGQTSGEGLPQSREEYLYRLDEARSEQRAEALRQVQIQAALALVVTSIGAIGVGWFFAGRMLRPVREITLHARELSESTLDRRISLSGPNDELKELGDTIDSMLERLERAFVSQRHFAAQASHELRTPLAIMGAEAEIAMASPDASERERATAAAIHAQVLRSERLVEGLLVLARSESTLREDKVVDIADLAGDAIGEQIGDADAAGVEVQLQLETARTSGDAVLLRHLIGNLINNGVRYNVDDGFLRIEVYPEPGHAVIRITNSGPVIPPGDVEGLFRPFQRGMDLHSRREGGFGLGLAIIRSVTPIHGGQLSVVARPEGGLSITVRFPAAPEGEPSPQPDTSHP